MKLKRMQKGGAAEGHSDMFWDGQKWVSASGGATYSNGTFYARGGSYSQNGGPTFPVAGAGAMFAQGGPVASFYVDGNGRPTPFAMAPGSGQGNGYLQDLPTHMNYGGAIPGAQLVNPFAMNPGSGTGTGYLQDLPTEMKKGGHAKKKMSPQQMQMMMQAMSQGQPGTGAQPPMNMGAPPQMGAPGMPQGQPMMPGMRDGGIHIKKANVGKFTAYKQRTGKTTEEALHSKDPHVRQMANFARNAKKWHHEMGGAVTQGGNVVRDNEMYMTGGEFHPLSKYMANGGLNFAPDQFDPNMDPGIIGDQQQSVYNPSTSVGNLSVNAPWRQGMTDSQSQQNINYGAGSVNAYDPSTGNTDNGSGSINGQNHRQGNNGRASNYLGAGFGALGAGIGVASYLSDRRDQRNLTNKDFNDRSTANQYTAMNQPGGMGDYDQYGSFRVNQNTPVRLGYFPPKMNKLGGYYQQGSEHELDEKTIKNLLDQGYKLQYL